MAISVVKKNQEISSQHKKPKVNEKVSSFGELLINNYFLIFICLPGFVL